VAVLAAPCPARSAAPFAWAAPPVRVAVGLGSVWVANRVKGTVTRIDPGE